MALDNTQLLKALEKVEKASRAVRISVCEESFALFFVYYYSRYVKYPFGKFHYEMFQDVEDLLNGKIKELAWVMFRESAKTSFAKAFLVWCVVYKKKQFINYDSYDKGNAESALFDVITELTSNRRLMADYGELYSRQQTDSPQIKRISNFITNNMVKVEAFSTQESPRGRVFGAQRPDLVIMDDFENNNTKDSDIVTSKVISHIDEFKKALDSAEGKVLYLCNYISDKGSVQHLMNRAKKNKNIRIRMVSVLEDYEIERNPQKDMYEITKGRPTWDMKYSIHKQKGKIALEEMLNEDGTNVFYPEMLNSPVDESAREFKVDYYKYRELSFVTSLNTRRFLTIDPRGKDDRNKGTDFIGVTMNFVDKENNFNIKTFKTKWNVTELVDFLFTSQKQYFWEVIGIEGTAFTEGLKPYLDTEQNKRGMFLPIQELKHGGVNKHTRIRGIIPYYEKGKVYHILEEGENSCRDLEDEQARFPKTTKDDAMDSLGYQLMIADAPAEEMFSEYELYKKSYV